MHRCDIRKAFRRLKHKMCGVCRIPQGGGEAHPTPTYVDIKFWCVGGVLLSHNPTIAVPSAQSSLATGIGTGPGVPSTLKPPTQTHLKQTTPRGCVASNTVQQTQTRYYSLFLRQTYCSRHNQSLCRPHTLNVVFCVGVLVPVTSNTSPCSQPWPINPIIYGEPQQKPHLKTGFPLRCFQRLSLPHVANQPCHWRDNWHTRGTSIPVLSY